MLQRKQSSAQDFDLVTDFKYGYRNREDITNLPQGVLVVGSQNVVTNTSNRIQIVKGFTLDGSSSTIVAPVTASYDFLTNLNAERNLRAYLDPTTAHAVLQYRYDDGSTITYRDLITTTAGLDSADFNFTEFWDTTEFKSLLLFVAHDTNVYEWNGAITTLASAGTNTLTKSGTTTWQQAGFYTTRDKKVIIKDVEYTYTAGETSTTLTGVTPDPALAGLVATDIVHQQYKVTANASISSISASFVHDVISTLRNQVYYGSLTNLNVYVSKINDYDDVGFTSPVRVVGEGALLYLDASCVAFIPQEDRMYISAGKDHWYETKFVLSSDLSDESFQITKLKTASRQGALSQAVVSKDKNNVAFISNEPVLTTIGRVANNLATPQAGDLSYPVVNDFNSYDFTDASVAYHKNFIYVSIPKAGLIRIYNQTDANNHYWEAPVTYPIARFSVIDGELYGHSYNTPETYKLFTGYNFNGFPIPALAVFSYQNFGTRARSKGFTQVYTEGYIGQNGILTLGVKKEIEGCASDTTYEIDGDQQAPIVCQGGSTAPLGKESIGNNPLGGDLAESTGLPPKLRVINTMSLYPYFYEVQFCYYSNAVDFRWEILAFGTSIVKASDLNNAIKK